MRVHVLRGDPDHYKCLMMYNSTELYPFSSRFNGKPIKGRWIDVKMIWDTARVPKGDYPSLHPNIPVFNQKAVTALKYLLEENGEIFPTVCGGERLFFFNVTRVIDALNESESEVIRFNNSSKVLDIDRYSFYEKKLIGASIFRIPQFLDWIYVTDIFVKRVESAGLKGFWFPLVWSSDPGDRDQIPPHTLFPIR
jgi:hypothetical protein